MFGGFLGKPKDESPGEKAMAISKTALQEDSGSSGGSMKSVHGFDPVAFERAAKAAKELDNSKNAKDAVRLIAEQEATKRSNNEVEKAKYQALKEEMAIRRVQEEEQAAQRSFERQTEHEKARADYKDQLERKRMIDQINAQRHLQEEERKKSEESLRRQEEIRRKTLEYEAELRQQTEMARVKAETEGRILQERKNHDLVLENKRLEAKEYRETVLESIKLAGSTIGEGVKEFVSDREKLGNVAATLTILALGIYSARVSTGVAGRYVEARLGKPALVRETTKRSVLQMIRSPYSTLKLAFGTGSGEDAMKNIVLEPSLASRLKRVAVSTSNTKKNNAPFRHLLLHGPPGTGKTLFAKGLARESGLHYAIMTGGDIAPLGKDAVTEIHKLFDWAQTTNKGVVLFVDEADAFLRKRSTEKISEDLRNALNAFLYRTGEASKKFMIVYASNQPEQFDWAINDRIDEIVHFDLPGYDERLRMLSQYMEQYLTNPPKGSKPITVSALDESVLTRIAVETEGYSGREISKLAIAWQAAAYGTTNATIDEEMLMMVLRESKSSKVQKLQWLGHKQVDALTSDSSPTAK